MNILILGGYGTFGGRLCQLLAADARVTLIVAGRNAAAASAFCQTLAGPALRRPTAFDRDGDLSEQLEAIRPDLVIDASGPFQVYGGKPYRLVEACLEHAIDYMDFADGADFVSGIGQFDARARALGRFVLSGVSSFPVLTAAVVRHLARDWRGVTAIRAGIAPSPYAGVGLNVIRAVAAYAGQPVRLVRDGAPAVAFGLTETVRYTIAPPGRVPLNSTCFSLVDVPDLQVLPRLWPGLGAVWVGAGPVPLVLHRMLIGLAWLVRWRLLPSLLPLAPLFHRVLRRVRWGEHRGGMFVEASGTGPDGRATSRAWHLLAEGDDGPYIPCMALQALVQRTLDGQRPPSGARAATGDLELADYQRLFAQRTIYSGERGPHDGAAPLFQRLLGSAWDTLPAPVRSMHTAGAARTVTGTATVRRGGGWLARIVTAVFRFPLAGDAVPVSVQLQTRGAGELWTRTFAGRRFSSALSAGAGDADRLLCERFGPFTFHLALVPDGGKLRFVIRGWRLGPMPLPRRWAPQGDSYEYADENAGQSRFGFHIEIKHPLTGPIVSYRGWLVPDTASVGERPQVDQLAAVVGD
jgi:hypothetical protein